MPADLSLYFHVPFCRSKCTYCDFYSEVGCGEPVFGKYVDNALEQLGRELAALNPTAIDTVFIGGGTPTLLPPRVLERFISGIISETGETGEFSIEANPESLGMETVGLLEEGPVNRISMGVQTYDENLLHWLGRPAGKDAVEQADRLLAERWTGELSRDLLAALPGGNRRLGDDISRALEASPGHLSLYELTVEEGTPLAADRRALEMLPEEDIASDEWEKALVILGSRGYRRYEVSNFAIPGRECRHNLRYWEMRPYLGIGPGAASTLPGKDGSAVRREEGRDLSRWLDGSPGCRRETTLSRAELMLEHFMMGLRTFRGVSGENIREVFGKDISDLVPGNLEKWSKAGFLELRNGNLIIAGDGMDLLDGILADMTVELENTSKGETCRWPALTGIQAP